MAKAAVAMAGRTRDLRARQGIESSTVTGATAKAFELSLFVWATVMSQPAEDRAIIDAGLTSLAFDFGAPLVCDEPAATYERAADEHGRLGISGATNRPYLGDKVRLIPGHGDLTVNLYDWYVCVRANRVEQLWTAATSSASAVSTTTSYFMGMILRVRERQPIASAWEAWSICPKGPHAIAHQEKARMPRVADVGYFVLQAVDVERQMTPSSASRSTSLGLWPSSSVSTYMLSSP